jgi:hypothetical protein
MPFSHLRQITLEREVHTRTWKLNMNVYLELLLVIVKYSKWYLWNESLTPLLAMHKLAG